MARFVQTDASKYCCWSCDCLSRLFALTPSLVPDHPDEQRIDSLPPGLHSDSLLPNVCVKSLRLTVCVDSLLQSLRVDCLRSILSVVSLLLNLSVASLHLRVDSLFQNMCVDGSFIPVPACRRAFYDDDALTRYWCGWIHFYYNCCRPVAGVEQTAMCLLHSEP